ncbi:MAG: PD-(D/E)XK nuclease family protein [Deltaproteobacteria bacterium]|nr:PD-(D/E)XK nuclease family protein [Deltaproteobacteria bacterium]
MSLSVRPKVYSLPSYSLTGDLLGFLRCGLQYRYTRIGKLPASRPVQQWFGEFIHGVLEEAFRRYHESVRKGVPSLPPWPVSELDDIRKLIKDRLAARGLRAWAPDLEQLGDDRAAAAVQELGPLLFPLIHRAEVRVTGARLLPPIASHLQFREADRYEMVGVVDVVTHVQLATPGLAGNPIVKGVRAALGGNVPPEFELIIDYKGMRRPPVAKATAKHSLWTQYEWQLQTYGGLRQKQADALQVVAGVLLYVNELHPTRSDLKLLKDEIVTGTTDVAPVPGSPDDIAIRAWRSSQPLPQLTLGYRLARALRIVPISAASVQQAELAFDAVVKDIETCRGREEYGTSLLNAWDRNPSEESTCVVCDSRTYCPDYQTNYAAQQGELTPRLPAKKI